ncbi:S-adenosyl-L-methionine-dependent methyltransferase [Conidiobolus coronatus NRRL 28638]|uniref:S-adenosyl-L-methionine-dependent methyltransferase n=1 Tax=Conidiobolus coronatus (strain ATCC 28846 / CBS 209.66 / NRRL 28638) TaxID=796925 RepID=A0A137P0R5_CONC2|nr:S-adenosyl-L-methionine-dependent methyltransferase [Conidiobolus coronatus NRRL 28638]|eukprot:KXN68592.1 S-adenosyl-L-methionine-dependent methyltransferase [Conidiobolus coronatus NRRL 28638]
MTTINANSNQKETQSKSMFDYNKGSNTQLTWLKNNLKHLTVAIENLPKHKGSLNIGDYGCSQGKNSMFIMKHILDKLQNNLKYLESLKQLIVYHEDLPDNDFIQVRNCIEDSSIGYKHHSLVTSAGIDVNPNFVGKSYYENIVQPGVLDLVFCYNSIHWMPEYFPSKYGLGYMAEYKNHELTSKFNEMSYRYLEKWLNLRYEELKQGGLITINFITDCNLLDLLNKYWLLALKKFGYKQSDFDKVMFPVYFRQITEIQSVIDKFSTKFEVVFSETNIEYAKFTKMEVKALTKNQILGCLKHYSNIDEVRKLELYQSFEEFIFDDGREYLEPDGNINWLVLRKI